MKRFSRARQCATLLACASICVPSVGWAQYDPDAEVEEAWEPEAAPEVDSDAIDAEEAAPPPRQRPRKMKQRKARPQRAEQPPPQQEVTRVRADQFDAPATTPPTVVAAPLPPPTQSWDYGGRTVGWVEREPNSEVIFGGVFVLTSAYLFSAMAAAGSPVKADEQLYIPLVGPWLDISKRPHCGPRKDQPSCRTEPANMTLLVTSGLAQGIGTLVLMGGIMFPKMKVVTTRVGEVQVLPSAAPGTAGLTAFGRLPL
jgi:hypothetical protein